jgi:hypothetical protein
MLERNATSSNLVAASVEQRLDRVICKHGPEVNLG